MEFDSFKFHQFSKGQSLSYLLSYIFQQNQLLGKLNIPSNLFNSFTVKLQRGYLDNPYHNSLHAFDVTQTMNFFLKKCNFIQLAGLTYLEVAAMYLAASCHDFEHP